MKSTKESSRKIYAMKVAFGMIAYIMTLYSSLVISGFNPSEIVCSAAIGSIGAIVTALNIADGMKGHEHD
jgi:hypothetical protein